MNGKLGKKTKGFWLDTKTIERYEGLKNKEGIRADDLMFSNLLNAYEGKAIEKPSEISVEEAKEVIICPHYEAYPKDPKFIKCHQFPKPRIRSKKDCEICKSMKTLFDKVSKDLHILAKKKSELERHIKSNEDSLRTVTSEYHRIKKELEILKEERAKYGEAHAPDSKLIQRIKELETEIEQLKKAPAPPKLEQPKLEAKGITGKLIQCPLRSVPVPYEKPFVFWKAPVDSSVCKTCHKYPCESWKDLLSWQRTEPKKPSISKSK